MIPQALFEPQDSKSLPPSLQFCADELRYDSYFIHTVIGLTPQISFSEVLENLITLALVKRHKESRAFSIHRLVQAQFGYYMAARDRQRAFEDSTKLLFAAFPGTDGTTGQLYDRWAQCRLFLQHVFSLMENYKKESAGSEGLQPIPQFCGLLCACAR